MKQFFRKRNLNVPFKKQVVRSTNPQEVTDNGIVVEPQDNEEAKKPAKNVKQNNKKSKKEEDMNIDEQISAAEVVLDEIERPKKVVKKDRGLIERCESSKIILTEDNRQVLND